MPRPSDGPTTWSANSALHSHPPAFVLIAQGASLGHSGLIILTLTAESALQFSPPARATQTVEQLPEHQQIRDPQRAAPTREHDRRVRQRGIRPPAWQRALRAIVIEEEDALLAPRPTHRDEQKLPSHPRVKRMRHTNGSLLTGGDERS
jgi:hypothetical protein